MSPIYSVRSSFDSYFYWSVFVFVAVFMTYFLTSMISLANMEDEQSNATVYAGYAPQPSYLQREGLPSATATEDGF